MKPNRFALLSIALLALTACNQQQSASSPPASPQNAESSAVQSPVEHTVKSQDGKITLKTHFSFGEPVEITLPEGVAKERVVLFKRDENADISLYATDLGEIKTNDIQTHFNQIKNSIENDKTLQNAQVQIADKRLSFGFTQKQDDITLNESCISAVAGKKLYSVCAESPETSLEDLNQLLQSTEIQE